LIKDTTTTLKALIINAKNQTLVKKQINMISVILSLPKESVSKILKNKKYLIIVILCILYLAYTEKTKGLEAITFHQTLRLDGSTHGDMDPQSTFICVDSMGNIHVIFYTIGDFGMGQLCYKIIGSNLFVVDSGPESAGDLTFIPGLAMDVDSHDYVHVVYGKGEWKSGRAQELRYAFFNGSIWENQIVSTLLTRDPSIKLDSDDKPHLSYLVTPLLDDYSSSSLYYAYFDDLVWHMQIVESDSYIWSQQMVLDLSNKPQIAYIAGPNSSIPTLKYARFNGTSWEIETVDDEDVGCYVSITLDSEDNPHISYGNHTLKHAYFDGITWHISQISEMSQASIEENVIALDSEGKPHIFYTYMLSTTNYLEPNNASYAFYTGTSWIVNRIPAENDSYLPMRGLSLALDSKNTAHLAYKIRVETGSVVAYKKGTFYSPFPLITVLIIIAVATCLFLIALAIIFKIRKK